MSQFQRALSFPRHSMDKSLLSRPSQMLQLPQSRRGLDSVTLRPGVRKACRDCSLLRQIHRRPVPTAMRNFSERPRSSTQTLQLQRDHCCKAPRRKIRLCLTLL